MCRCSLIAALTLCTMIVPGAVAQSLPSGALNVSSTVHSSTPMPDAEPLELGGQVVTAPGTPSAVVTPMLLTLPPTAEARAAALSFNQRGVNEFGKLDYEQAIADFDEALRLDPTDAVFYFNRGNAYFAQGNAAKVSSPCDYSKWNAAYTRALGDLFESILRDPKRGDSYLLRARIFTAQKRYGNARADYSVVLRNDPAHQVARKERNQLDPLEKKQEEEEEKELEKKKEAAAAADQGTPPAPATPATPGTPPAPRAPASASTPSLPLQSILGHAAIKEAKSGI